jgi:hypothetical protein
MEDAEDEAGLGTRLAMLGSLEEVGRYVGNRRGWSGVMVAQ